MYIIPVAVRDGITIRRNKATKAIPSRHRSPHRPDMVTNPTAHSIPCSPDMEGVLKITKRMGRAATVTNRTMEQHMALDKTMAMAMAPVTVRMERTSRGQQDRGRDMVTPAAMAPVMAMGIPALANTVATMKSVEDTSMGVVDIITTFNAR